MKKLFGLNTFFGCLLFLFSSGVIAQPKNDMVKGNLKMASVHVINADIIKSDDIRKLKVPEQFQTIAIAVDNAIDGDMIIISPGEYFEKEIEINKSLTISSEWKISGEESLIDETILDAQGKRLFIISADSVEISGLTIRNGDHSLEITGRVSIINNHFINNFDGISLESGSGGYIAFNRAENDKDDALDIDIGGHRDNIGSDVIIEYNTFLNCNDDGIEIRLFKYPDQNINYIVRHNQIIGSNNAGIQLISYDTFTGKRFDIHHNIFKNCKTGLGCMAGAKTIEDLSGASMMDEQVCFYNNTVLECEMGATGGNHVIAANNIIQANEKGGFKNFGPNSVIINNLFFNNVGESLIKIDSAVLKKGNIFSNDPKIDKKTYMPAPGSPAIDAGIGFYLFEGKEMFRIPKEQISGSAPDLGAIEKGIAAKQSSGFASIIVDAGGDQVIGPLSSEVMLSAKIQKPENVSLKSSWKLTKGSEKVQIINPDQVETRVLFNRQGIYQFTFKVSDDIVSRTDNVVVRYIQDGTGKKLFLKEDVENIIPIADYSYSYGNVQKKKMNTDNKSYYMLLKEGSGKKAEGLLEFSVGMAEANQYNVWLLLKPLKKNNKISLEFDGKLVGEMELEKDKDFQWLKMPQRIIVTPGQWQLLINDFEGKVLLDKILITKDENFIPR